MLQTGRFRQTDRLRRSLEFQQAIRRGRRCAGAAFVVVVSTRVSTSGDEQVSRLGVTVSRKVGGAVVRNRVKRRIREWFRVQRGSLGAGFDWVVIGRSAAAGLDREAAEAELSGLCGALLGAGAQGGAA